MYTSDSDDIAMNIVLYFEKNDEDGMFESSIVKDKQGHIRMKWLDEEKPLTIDVRIGAGGIVGIDLTLPFIIPEQAFPETLLYLSKVNAYRDPYTGLPLMAHMNLDMSTGIVSVYCSYFIEDREAFAAEEFEDYLSAVLNTALCEFDSVKRFSFGLIDG